MATAAEQSQAVLVAEAGSATGSAAPNRAPASEAPVAEAGPTLMDCESLKSEAIVCIAKDTATACTSCENNPETIDTVFPMQIENSFTNSQVMAVPGTPEFCTAAEASICTEYETKHSCCCTDQMIAWQNCIVEKELSPSIDIINPSCTATCGLLTGDEEVATGMSYFVVALLVSTFIGFCICGCKEICVKKSTRKSIIIYNDSSKKQDSEYLHELSDSIVSTQISSKSLKTSRADNEDRTCKIFMIEEGMDDEITAQLDEEEERKIKELKQEYFDQQHQIEVLEGQNERLLLFKLEERKEIELSKVEDGTNDVTAQFDEKERMIKELKDEHFNQQLRIELLKAQNERLRSFNLDAESTHKLYMTEDVNGLVEGATPINENVPLDEEMIN